MPISQLLRKRKFTQQELDELRVEFESKLKEYRLGILSIYDGATKQEEDAHWTLLKELERIGFKLDIDVHKEINEKSEICIKCNKNKTTPKKRDYNDSYADTEDLFCQQCRDEWDKEQYERYCERSKKKEDANPLRKYAREIVHLTADYEIPYERHKKAKEERLKYGMEEDRNAIDEYSEMYHILHAKKKPEYITEEQWQLAKRKARDYIKEIKYNDVEFRFKIEYNPLRIFEDKISNISEFCECTASGLRQGICCDICKLIKNFSNSSILLCAVS